MSRNDESGTGATTQRRITYDFFRTSDEINLLAGLMRLDLHSGQDFRRS